MASEPSLEHWYAALGAQHGVEVDCCGNSPESVRQRLYQARKAAQDPDLDVLSIAVSPANPANLWIYRSKADGDKEVPVSVGETDPKPEGG